MSISPEAATLVKATSGPFEFSDASQTWVPAVSPSRGAGVAPGANLRIGTLNVLADCFPFVVEVMICSPERVAALLQQLRAFDGDIVGLNEVTPNILSKLLADPFIRASYFVSEADTNKETTSLGRHGCLLLSKIPFVGLYRAKIIDESDLRAVVIGVFRKPAPGAAADSDLFAVASQHTQAYQTLENKALRRAQILGACAATVRALAEHGAATIEGDAAAFILMGDLNLHYVCEDQVILDARMLDVWAETNFDAPTRTIADGFTYDSRVNKMIPRYVPGENRRMRLDRILCSAAFARMFAFATPCAFWAHESINKSKNLWISDHFGLAIEVAARVPGAPLDFDGADETRPVRAAMRARGALPPEKSTYTKWTFAKTLPVQLVAVTLRATLGW